MDTFEKISSICCEQLGCDESLLTRQTTFDEIQADSLDVVEIIMAIEQEFDITIPESQEDKINNLGELCDYVDSLL